MNNDQAMVGRTSDGMVFVALPPGAFAVSFMLLCGTHVSMNCGMVDSMAAHMLNEDVAQQRVAPPEVIRRLLSDLKERHGTEQVDNVWKRGDAETFDGYYYANIHPIDLIGIAQVCAELKEATPQVEQLASVHAILNLWVDAGRRFVTPQEVMATMGSEGRA